MKDCDSVIKRDIEKIIHTKVQICTYMLFGNDFGY